MLTRRIIPCLDVRRDRVVKGVRFEGLRDVGDPVELGARYADSGADELCFLDVAASVDGAPTILDLAQQVAREVFVPFTVGGGIRSTEDARAALRAGADKVALNTAAIRRPELLEELAAEFGRQCVVLSVDTRKNGGGWVVTTHGARLSHDRPCLDWVLEGVERGAGEILLNVVDADGGREGYALDVTGEIAAAVSVPVIASGGAGSPADVVRVFRETDASAALLASIFHDGSYTPSSLKKVLADAGIEVRP